MDYGSFMAAVMYTVFGERTRKKIDVCTCILVMWAAVRLRLACAFGTGYILYLLTLRYLDVHKIFTIYSHHTDYCFFTVKSV